jgi:hypothetical protein
MTEPILDPIDLDYEDNEQLITSFYVNDEDEEFEDEEEEEEED